MKLSNKLNIACISIVLISFVAFVITDEISAAIDVTNPHAGIKCDQTLLEIFGMPGNLMEESANASPLEKIFCRRNKSTCCTNKNLELINNRFSEGAKQLKKKFEVFEELLALFKGEKFWEFVSGHENNDRCNSMVKNLKIELNGNEYSFFTETYINIELEKIANILLDTEIYIKKNLWFHSNVVCSICGQRFQHYYNLSKDGSIYKVHLSTCFEVMEEREYELEALGILNNFITPVVNFTECVLEEEPEELETDNVLAQIKDDMTNEMKLTPMSEEKFIEMKGDFKECLKDRGITKVKCKQLCWKDLRIYKFPEPNFFRNIQVSLKVLFNAFTEMHIADYYTDIKGEDWVIGNLDGPVVFYENNPKVNEYKINNLNWQISSTTGHNMYREIMSKKFINRLVESAQKVSIVIFGIVGLISLI